MIRFYSYLSGHSALWWPPHWRGILRKKPILRLQDGSHVNPFRSDGSPNAYIAIDGDTETSLPIVKTKISLNDDAHNNYTGTIKHLKSDKMVEKRRIINVETVRDIRVNSLIRAN